MHVNGSLFIPRSAIAAFGQSEAARTLFDALKGHPLLSRVRYDVFEGDIETVINTYPTGGTPDMIIVEHDGPIEAITRLAEVSAATTHVIVVGNVNDIGRYRRLLDEGVSDYVFLPVNAEFLLASIARGFAQADNVRTGMVITFLPAGGGSGSSTMAQNAAVLLSKIPHKRAILLDFDIFMGSVALNFDLHPMKGLRDLLHDAKAIKSEEIGRLALERTASLMVLCSPPTLEPGFPLLADSFIDLVEQARRQADYVVIDMPGGWGALHARMLATSEHVTFVAAPTMVGYQNLHGQVGMAEKLRGELPPAHLVLNRVPPAAQQQVSTSMFRDLMAGEPLHEIPEAPEHMLRASEKAQVLAEMNAGDPVLRGLRDLVDRVAGLTAAAPVAQPQKGLLRFLRKST